MFCILILFYNYPFLPCITLFIVIGASDYFDGKLARKYHVETHIGAKLDVFSDFFFIFVACLSWAYLDLLPYWMVGVIILKFLEFLITSFISKKKTLSSFVFKFDPLGRGVAVAFYVLPVLILLPLYFYRAFYEQLINLICISITMSAISSSVFRIMSLNKTKKLRVK